MKSKHVFLIVCTLAHPVLFSLGGVALWCLIGTRPGGPGQSLGQLYMQASLPLYPWMPAFSRTGVSPLLMSVLFFLANGFLWALSLWYARVAWRRLRNLPPVAQPS